MPDREPRPTEVGETLARLREARGWSGSEAARRTGLPQGTFARFEHGRGVPDDQQMSRLITGLQPDDDTAARMRQLVRSPPPRRVVNRRPNAHSFQREWRQLEANAAVLRSVTVSIVPGLLQTADYAAAIADSGDLTPEHREKWLQERARRRAQLDRIPDAQFLLTVGAVTYPQAPPAVLAAQIDELAERTTGDRPRIGVIAPTTGPSPELPGNLDLFRAESGEQTAVTMSHAGVLVIRDPDELTRLNALVDRLAGLAVWGDEARAVLLEVRRTFER